MNRGGERIESRTPQPSGDASMVSRTNLDKKTQSNVCPLPFRSGHVGGAMSSAEWIISCWFEKLNIDPAIASSVFVTTITDVIGFLSFLGLGSYFFLN